MHLVRLRRNWKEDETFSRRRLSIRFCLGGFKYVMEEVEDNKVSLMACFFIHTYTEWEYQSIPCLLLTAETV